MYIVHPCMVAFSPKMCLGCMPLHHTSLSLTAFAILLKFFDMNIWTQGCSILSPNVHIKNLSKIAICNNMSTCIGTFNKMSNHALVDQH